MEAPTHHSTYHRDHFHLPTNLVAKRQVEQLQPLLGPGGGRGNTRVPSVLATRNPWFRLDSNTWNVYGNSLNSLRPTTIASGGSRYPIHFLSRRSVSASFRKRGGGVFHPVAWTGKEVALPEGTLPTRAPVVKVGGMAWVWNYNLHVPKSDFTITPCPHRQAQKSREKST